MTTNAVRIGDVELTRVGYVDVGIPPERVGLTPAHIAAVSWAEPLWATGAELLAGGAVWVIQDGDARIAVDPLQAADEIVRTDADAAVHQEAFAAILEAAGMPRESFTHAISTHVEGIGMWAWRNDDGSWVPFFPNAPILIAQGEFDAIDAGTHPSPVHAAFHDLRALGALQPVAAGYRVTEHVSLEHAGAHTPGHLFVRISSRGEQAVMLGHMAVSPLHLVTGPCPNQHPLPDEAQANLEALLAEDDTLLIGPLWPAPGAGRWDGERLVAVS